MKWREQESPSFLREVYRNLSCAFRKKKRQKKKNDTWYNFVKPFFKFGLFLLLYDLWYHVIALEILLKHLGKIGIIYQALKDKEGVITILSFINLLNRNLLNSYYMSEVCKANEVPGFIKLIFSWGKQKNKETDLIKS